ncbi:MAG: HEAT repeat domain-containing protein [Candidatus Hermodarchaeota archaeon]
MKLPYQFDKAAHDSLFTTLIINNLVLRYHQKGILLIYGVMERIRPSKCKLKDPDSHVRRNTLIQLSKFQDIDQLLQTLDDKDIEVKALTIEHLGRLKDSRALGSLIKALRDPDLEIRSRAAWALGEIGDPWAVEPLIAALKDEYLEVSTNVIRSLGLINDEKSITYLCYVLKYEESHLRIKAIQTLAHIPDPKVISPLIAALGNRDPAIYNSAIDALVNVGKAAVQPLINVLNVNNTLLLLAATKALIKIGISPIQLAKSQNPQFISLLLQALDDNDPGIKVLAIEHLGRLKDSRALGSLIKALRDPDQEVRSRAAWALGEIGDPWAVEPLIAALKDEYLEVSTNVIRSLGLIDDEQSMKYLCYVLRYEESYLRIKAIQTLGHIPDHRVINPLIEALGDQNPEIHDSAVDTLANIGRPAVQPLMNVLNVNNTLLLLGATKALIKIGIPPIDFLIESLNHDAESIAHLAAVTLAGINDSRAINALLPELKKNIRLRCTEVIEALGKNDHSKVEKFFAECLDDHKGPFMQFHAAKVLINKKKEEYTPKIVSALMNCVQKSCILPANDERIKSESINLLAKFPIPEVSKILFDTLKSNLPNSPLLFSSHSLQLFFPSLIIPAIKALGQHGTIGYIFLRESASLAKSKKIKEEIDSMLAEMSIPPTFELVELLKKYMYDLGEDFVEAVLVTLTEQSPTKKQLLQIDAFLLTTVLTGTRESIRNAAKRLLSVLKSFN